MTKTVVEQLEAFDHYTVWHQREIINKAIDRIKEMEQAMREIVSVPLWDEYRCIEIARAALGDRDA